MPLKRRDSVAQSNKFSKIAMGMLSDWQVSSDPDNFTVAYEIAKASNTQLLRVFDRYISEGRTIDNYCLEEWRQRYVNQTQDKESEWITDINKVILDLQTHVESSGYSVEEYLEQLNSNMKKLAVQPETGRYLTQILQDMHSATTVVQSQQEKLKQQLSSSKEETDVLRNELHKLQKLSVTDPLTGLLNRRGLDMYIDELENKSVSVTAVVMDIDHFKRFNDDFGHLIGDVVLVKVAEQLTKSETKEMTVTRYGGEEFLLVVEDDELEQVAVIAEQIRKQVESMKLINGKTKQRLPRITISLGIAKQAENEGFDTMVNRADKALYEAKRAGRNQIQIAS